MSTTLGDLNTLINDRRRDTTTNSIDMSTVGFRAINSALNIWNQIHDWPWTIKQYSFNYNYGISTYVTPTDLKYPLTLKEFKGDKVPEYTFLSALKFDGDINYSRKFAIETVAGVQDMRVRGPGSYVSVNTMGSVTGNGTYVGAGAISNVATDLYEYFDNPGAISFDYSGTSGTLTNSTQQAVNLASYANRSSFFFRFYFPTVTQFSSITLKVGSDASNYYSTTITTDYLGSTPIVGWNTLKGGWNTKVGTPNLASITYTQLTVAYSGSTTATAFRVQNLFDSLDIPMVLTYYSTYMVNDVSGAVQLQIFNDATATTDTPMWTGRWDMATEAFVNSVLELIFWMTGEQDDKALAQQKIVDLTSDLRNRYPSQRRYPTLRFSTDTNYESSAGRYNNRRY